MVLKLSVEKMLKLEALVKGERTMAWKISMIKG